MDVERVRAVWLDDQVTYLKSVWLTDTGIAEICRTLSKRRRAIYRKAARLGLGPRPSSPASLRKAIAGVRSSAKQRSKNRGDGPSPMPECNRERIRDRVLGLRFLPGKSYSLTQIALVLSDLWPGVTANQVRGLIAGLASKEKAIRAAMAVRNAERTARLESG